MKALDNFINYPLTDCKENSVDGKELGVASAGSGKTQRLWESLPI